MYSTQAVAHSQMRTGSPHKRAVVDGPGYQSSISHLDVAIKIFELKIRAAANPLRPREMELGMATGYDPFIDEPNLIIKVPADMTSDCGVDMVLRHDPILHQAHLVLGLREEHPLRLLPRLLGPVVTALRGGCTDSGGWNRAQEQVLCLRATGHSVRQDVLEEPCGLSKVLTTDCAGLARARSSECLHSRELAHYRRYDYWTRCEPAADSYDSGDEECL